MSRLQFDIKYRPQIESGEYKVETNFGSPVEIICWNRRDDTANKTIVGIIRTGTVEEIASWNIGGKLCDATSTQNTAYDLFIVTPEPELTDFEQEVSDIVEYCKKNGKIVADGYAKRHAKSLLSLAREQFIKDGYVIEKKAFHDAVKKVDPEVMKEVSENIDKTGPTEFERRIKDLLAIKCEIFYNEDIGGCYDLKGLCRVILECAREQLKPDINFMQEDNYKTAYKEGYDEGRVDALKDLPRWKKVGLNTGQTTLVIGYTNDEDKLYRNGYVISLTDLEKLPKEDEK